MTGGEEEHKKGEGKGFAGLSSLVSEVDTTPPPAASAPSTERPAPQATQPRPTPPHKSYQEPAQPSSSGSSGGKWVLGIAAVIGLLWLIGQSDKSPTSPAPAYSPPVQTATPTYSPPAELQAPSRPQESMPPVGQDLAFSTAQIQYCLAEEIRLEGAKSVANNLVDSHVRRFNMMVADYNSRCGSFRYRNGTLESARENIKPFRSEIQAEGARRFTRSLTGGSLSSTNSGSQNQNHLDSESLSVDEKNILMKALSADSLSCSGSAVCEFEEFELLPVDVDMDGKNEYLVRHGSHCGSGGCSIFLFKESKTDGWKQIASAFGFMRVGEMHEKGYRNLIVESKAYRTEGGFDLTSKEYYWDGIGYRPYRNNP